MYHIGKTYSGFTLVRHDRIEEIDAEVFLFNHHLLDCPLLAIKNSDANKTFAVAFNTIPEDSTGVAHILEHSVLMGSKKYPVKDVFGEINKGGLMTFLNAMTGSDCTYYPFATRNMKEYFNIMGVYCDVVFNPLLLPSTFEQEGWHYHREETNGPLTYQGVVYNEMKGAFSDPVRLIFSHIFEGLMPESTYAHESGGDPRNIPDLSYEQFTAFHRRHYHPSNSFFFVYGDALLEEELSFLEKNFLVGYTEKGQRSQIVKGREISEPVFISDRYSVDSADVADKTFLAVGTQVATVEDRLQNAAFQVIANILFNSDGSPLKNAIISSGLGRDFGGFYVASSSVKTFMVSYLVGSEAERREPFLECYTSTLRSMVSDGLDRDLVLAELNKYEFSLREEAGKAQRGLDLIGKALVALKYDTDPFASLVSEELMATLREKALNEKYFEELIEKYLIDNPATATVTLVPDPEKQAATQQEVEQELADHDASLSPDEGEQLIVRTRELMQLQQQPNSVEDLALLPQLSKNDLTAERIFHQVEVATLGGCEFLVNDLPTNHISYVDIGFDIRCLPQRLIPYLDAFGVIISEIGTKRLDYMAFAKELATCTGGFSHSMTSYSKQTSSDAVRPIFWLHVRCLPSFLERALHLVAEVLTEYSLANRKRIREIVTREFAWAEHAAQSEGYNLAASRAFSHLSNAGRYNELFSGFSSYQTMKELVAHYDEREEEFLAALQEIAATLFKRNNLLIAATADRAELEVIERVARCLPDELPESPLVVQPVPVLDLPDHEAFISSAEVVFAVQGGRVIGGGLPAYNGHFEVLKTYLSRDYLWNTVRQMGGAYGCFVQFSHLTGNLAFVSYRDPQVRKTYEAYEKTAEVIAGLDISEKVLEQLIIGTYGTFDPLHSAAALGVLARNEYLSGITPEFKKKRIEEILGTTVADMKKFSSNFAEMRDKSHRCIIGNRMKIEADRDLFSSFIEL